MNIFANTAVTISFKLYDADNKLLEESPEPLVYLHGGHSGIFPKIEEALNNKKIGDTISVTLDGASPSSAASCDGVMRSFCHSVWW